MEITTQTLVTSLVYLSQAETKARCYALLVSDSQVDAHKLVRKIKENRFHG